MQTFGKIDSKFRFVILASKRAKQILKGAKVKVRSKSKNPIRIAQIEMKEGLIDFEILQPKREDGLEVEEQVLSVDDGAEDIEDSGKGAVDDEERGEDVETEDVVEADYVDGLPDEGAGEEKEDG
ncbi:MAG: DNA-directed RNA polymerase subunit omega [Candidatus Aminicenantes bacterium]|nr:DNA-directed RNA polymerase subunit omega [Candidatus Aminicenantes bacterium]